MTTRKNGAALLAASVLFLAPGLLAQKSSTYKPPAYTPPPPKPYTPPPRTYSPPANNNNRTTPSQRPQASNSNTVRPSPRPTVTPRNPQPNRQPLTTRTTTPANNNTKARAVANDNARAQQQALWKKQADQHKAQQQQLFKQKQDEQKKQLSEKQQADAKARLARLRAANAQNGGSAPVMQTPANHNSPPANRTAAPSAKLDDHKGKAKSAFNNAAPPSPPPPPPPPTGGGGDKTGGGPPPKGKLTGEFTKAANQPRSGPPKKVDGSNAGDKTSTLTPHGAPAPSNQGPIKHETDKNKDKDGKPKDPKGPNDHDPNKPPTPPKGPTP
jgi:hypothetical protein